MAMKLILASTSPYRRQLLISAGLSFESMAPQVEEKEIVGKSPRETAMLRSHAKALNVSKQMGEKSICIAADQTMSLDGKCFDKVSSPEEAYSCLRSIQGKAHLLHSAFTVMCGTSVQEGCVDVSMFMRRLNNGEINSYIKTDEWRGSVGCYKIEGIGQNLFEKIDGKQSDIIGLPMLEILEILREFGVNPLS